MIDRNNGNDSGYRVDDTFDDAAAAYKEVMERTTSREDVDETPARSETVEREEAGGEPAAAPRSNGKAGSSKEPVAANSAGKGSSPKTDAESREDDRDAKGRFKTKADKAGGDGEGEEGAAESPEAAPSKPTANPPPSFSVPSKAAWAKLPEPVRADILKREQEMATGLAALRDYKDLKPWADMAAKHNTSISAALQNYVGIETQLKRDPGAGMALIAQNVLGSGPDGQAKAAQLFAHLAQKFGAGPQQQQQQQDPVASVISPLLKPLMDEISGIKGQLTTRQEAESNARLSSLDSALKTLEADPSYPYVADLINDMSFLIESGRVQRSGNDLQDFKTAYEMAARLNGPVSEALIEQRLTEEREATRQREQEAADKAKRASRSVTGSRIPGTVTTTARGVDADPDDLEDVVRAAVRMHSR